MMTAAAFALMLLSAPMELADPVRCSGCACRGGPGYRARDGRCVGWKALTRKCGSPPTTRCNDERGGRRRD